MVTPKSTARFAVPGFKVSTEIAKPSRRSSTGRRRSHSSASAIRADPGRVDSAPTSIICAPSSAISRARTAAASGFRNRPPSEKESGVTFRMPMSWEKPQGVPVVLVVGALELYDPERIAQVKADGLLKKPFEATAVLETIRPLLEAAAKARPPKKKEAPAEPEYERTMAIAAPKK